MRLSTGAHPAILFLLLMAASCHTPGTPPGGLSNEADTLELRYARAFRVLKFNSCRHVEVLDPSNGSSIQRISVGDCNHEGCDRLPGKLSRMASLSTTHVAMLAELSELSNLKGVAYSDRILDEEVNALIRSGEISSLGNEGDPDLESLIRLGPDAFFIYPYDAGDGDKYKEAGIPAVMVAEYLESTPLGRAEWLLFFGSLTNKIELADSLFRAIEHRYLQAKTEAMRHSHIPSVFTGTYYQGNWYAPSGESFIASFIDDAAARYVFEDTKGADNLSIEMEEMIERAHDADYWGKIVFEAETPSRASIAESDPRLMAFRAFRDSGLFVCNAAQTDYFGKGVIEPDEVLLDLIQVFHPGDYPSRVSKYFHPW